jgi:nucleoside-diphosphate-sugar epimerase
MKVLVVGAYGRTGKYIVEILGKSNSGHDVFGFIRRQEQVDELKQLGAKEIFVGDVTNESDLKKAVHGMDVVIYAAGSAEKSTQEETIKIDKEAAILLIDICVQENVKHFVMISAYGADTPEIADCYTEYWDAMDGRVYFNAKADADKHLCNSGLTYTIIRPGTLDMSEPTGTVEVSKKFDFEYTSDKVVSRADVAQVAVSSLSIDNMKNKMIEVMQGNVPIDEALRNYRD